MSLLIKWEFFFFSFLFQTNFFTSIFLEGVSLKGVTMPLTFKSGHTKFVSSILKIKLPNKET